MAGRDYTAALPELDVKGWRLAVAVPVVRPWA